MKAGGTGGEAGGEEEERRSCNLLPSRFALKDVGPSLYLAILLLMSLLYVSISLLR